MADDKVCIFIGKRGTGKSTLVTDILWHKRHLPAGIAMSGTEEGNGYYKQFIPDIFVYGEYNKDAIEKLIERQKERAEYDISHKPHHRQKERLASAKYFTKGTIGQDITIPRYAA